MFTKKQLEDLYKAEFKKELARRSNEGYTVFERNPDGSKKFYRDTGAGKFYLCGFAYLHYNCTTPEGRKLHSLAKKLKLTPSKDYYGGFNFKLESARSHSNGMFEIMTAAYNKVASFIESQGYPVYVQSRLD